MEMHDLLLKNLLLNVHHQLIALNCVILILIVELILKQGNKVLCLKP